MAIQSAVVERAFQVKLDSNQTYSILHLYLVYLKVLGSQGTRGVSLSIRCQKNTLICQQFAFCVHINERTYITVDDMLTTLLNQAIIIKKMFFYYS